MNIHDENCEWRYAVFATTQNGKGYITKIGEYAGVEDIGIRIATFAKDVKITIERVCKTHEND